MDNDKVLDAEIIPDVPSAPTYSPPDSPIETEAQAPMVNGQTIEKVRYLDYENIRVVFDARSGAVLGTMLAKPVKKKKLNG